MANPPAFGSASVAIRCPGAAPAFAIGRAPALPALPAPQLALSPPGAASPSLASNVTTSGAAATAAHAALIAAAAAAALGLALIL